MAATLPPLACWAAPAALAARLTQQIERHRNVANRLALCLPLRAVSGLLLWRPGATAADSDRTACRDPHAGRLASPNACLIQSEGLSQQERSFACRQTGGGSPASSARCAPALGVSPGGGPQARAPSFVSLPLPQRPHPSSHSQAQPQPPLGRCRGQSAPPAPPIAPRSVARCQSLPIANCCHSMDPIKGAPSKLGENRTVRGEMLVGRRRRASWRTGRSRRPGDQHRGRGQRVAGQLPTRARRPPQGGPGRRLRLLGIRCRAHYAPRAVAAAAPRTAPAILLEKGQRA